MNRFFTVIAVFSYITCIAAQPPEKKATKFTVYINEETGNVKAEVLDTKNGPVVKEYLTYYWYVPNQIMETKGGYSGRLLHGNYTSFYDNKNLKEKGRFSGGLKSGKWMKWYDNGKIMEIVNWKSSRKNGKYKLYNEMGEVVLEANFSNDKLNGKTVSYHAGKILSVKNYKNGDEIIEKTEGGNVEKKKPEDKAVKSNTKKKERDKKPLKDRLKELFRKKEANPDKQKKKEQSTKQSTGRISHTPHRHS